MSLAEEAVLFAFFPLGLGLFLLGLGLVLLKRGLETRTWHTTPGIVERSQIVREKAAWGYRYQVRLTYRYVVGNHSLTGTAISRCGAPPNSDRADDLEPFLAEHPVGAEVTVHYDPANPGEACLVPGVAWFSLIPLIVGLGVTTRAVTALITALRRL